jgi:hypothetical protein
LLSSNRFIVWECFALPQVRAIYDGRSVLYIQMVVGIRKAIKQKAENFNF